MKNRCRAGEEPESDRWIKLKSSIEATEIVSPPL